MNLLKQRVTHLVTPHQVFLVRQLANLHLVKLGLVGRKPALGLELQDLDRNPKLPPRLELQDLDKKLNQNLVLVTLLSYKIPKLPLRSELQDLVRSLKLPPRLEQQDLGKKPKQILHLAALALHKNLKQALHLPSQVEVLFLDSQSQDQQAQDLPNLDRVVLQFSATRPRLQFLPR